MQLVHGMSNGQFKRDTDITMTIVCYFLKFEPFYCIEIYSVVNFFEVYWPALEDKLYIKIQGNVKVYVSFLNDSL